MTVTAQSRKTLTKNFAAQFQAQGAANQKFAAAAAQAPKRTAIFGIHGISPTQRYAFQDQVATSLQSALDALEQVRGSDRSWKAVVHWPHGSGKATVGDLRPSALRLYRDDDDPLSPVHDVYDVYEGYWSPLSKGKTNILSALQWLLNCTFLGTSSTANIPCTRAKLSSDLTYVGGLAALIAVAFVLALVAGFLSWNALACSIPGMCYTSFSSVIANPIAIAVKLPLPFYAQLVVEIAAAYVVVQLWVVHGVSASRRARTDESMKDAKTKGWFHSRTIQAAAFHRYVSIILWIALVVLVAVAAFLVVANSHLANVNPSIFIPSSLGVVATVALLQVARAKADFAVEDVLGDIQIYTTHDENATYYVIRQGIIEVVSDALLSVLDAVDPANAANNKAPYYDRLHLFGHSLGSTIAMDVLISLRQLVEQSLLPPQNWARIRSLTTFGTSLEKTRFFFDVRKPTINATQDQFENDVYGRFFSDNPAVLANLDNRQGIYWSNLWYFRDIVANEIVSYASDVAPGQSFTWQSGAPARPICANYQLPHNRPRFAWVHSDYLSDPLFWDKVAPVLA